MTNDIQQPTWKTLKEYIESKSGNKIIKLFEKTNPAETARASCSSG